MQLMDWGWLVTSQCPLGGMTLYKHTEARYADELIRNGSFQLGQLSFYGDIEKHGPEIGDPHENSMGRMTHIKHAVLHGDGRVEGDQRIKHVANLQRKRERGETIAKGKTTVTDSYFMTLTEYAQPAYVWCLSESPDPAVGRRMKESYDAVVEVRVTATDLRSLVRTLRTHVACVEMAGIGPASYLPNRLEYNEPVGSRIAPWFAKEPPHEYQREWRVVAPVRRKTLPLPDRIMATVDFCTPPRRIH